MIGKIITGKSFSGCIKYCLNDKLENKNKPGQIVKGRAEILLFNQCFGNEKELIKQFSEVRQLNKKLAKPVQHITLSFAPEEKLPPHQLTELVEDFAKEMGFDKHQFIAVEHTDTSHQHLHIIVNRVGFNGKTLSDSNNYKRMADCCRRMETKYGLQKVLNPKKFLSKEQRDILRRDRRKEQLKRDIIQSLGTSNTYATFEQKMKQLQYEVIKSRGIAFRDPRKVYTKGSAVGFSLSVIERILQLSPAQKKNVLVQMEMQAARKTEQAGQHKVPATSADIPRQADKKQSPIVAKDIQLDDKATPKPGSLIQKAWDVLTGSDAGEQQGLNQELTKEEIKRRRKKKPRP
ncbi:MAG: relaxase/mobilization nuclease domain-containing protein [Agriterribacter sp.]